MQISYQQNINQNYKPQFNGIPYAYAKIKNTKNNSGILIYQLEPTDYKFLHKMNEKLDLSKLVPEIKSKDELKSWKELIQDAIATLGLTNTKVYLAVNSSNNKPCGILSELTYFDSSIQDLTKHINYLATWPDKLNHNVKGAGKSLIRVVLDNAETEHLGTTLKTCPYAPKGARACEPFYKNLGFTKAKSIEPNKLQISKENITQTIIEKFFPILDFEKITDGKSVDLSSTLNIKYIPNFFERIFGKK